MYKNLSLFSPIFCFSCFDKKARQPKGCPAFLFSGLCHQTLCAVEQVFCNQIDLWLIVCHDCQIYFDLWFGSGWTDNHLQIVLQIVFQYIGSWQINLSLTTGTEIFSDRSLVICTGKHPHILQRMLVDWSAVSS